MAMETWCCRGEGSTWMIMPWIWMNGGDVLDDETRKVKFAEEPAVQAIQFLSDLVKKYKIWPRSGVLQAGPEGTWYGQLVVLSWTGAFDVANLTVTNPPKFKWDIAAIPVPSEGAQRISGVGGWLFSAWKQSKHIKETMEFIKFMTTPVWHRHVSKYGYALSGLSSIGKERLAEVPQLKVFLDAMAGGKARPRSSQYPLITEAFQQAIDETIFGDRPVQEALTDATKKIEEAVALEEKE
jgi:multiple sugar transport system substrate-binding protein